LRGKHGKHNTKDPIVIKRVEDHINSIPRIERHYTRSSTTRQYICGSKTISGIYDDYVLNCKEDEVEFVNYAYFHKVFKRYNFAFFTPKKDQCDTCFAYQNASETEKQSKKNEADDCVVAV